MRTTILIITGLFLVVGGAMARPLSMDDAIKLALSYDKQLRVARQNVDKASQKVREAYGYATPTLSITGTYIRNIQAPVFFLPNFSDPSAGFQTVRVALDNQYNAQAQVQQVLFSSEVITGIGASKIYEDAASEQYYATVATTIAETKKRYYNALAAAAFVRIARATLENVQSTSDNIQKLFAEGLVAEFDAIRANVAVENVRPQVTQAEAGYKTAMDALKISLGLSVNDTLELTEVIEESVPPLPDEAGLVKQALESNYDIEALELQRQVVDAYTDLYRAEYYPTLAAFGTVQNQGQSNDFNNFLNATSTNVGLNLSMNLNFFKTDARIQQAKIDYENISRQAEALRDGVVLQTRALWNMLQSARERILAQSKNVEQAQRGVDIAGIRYREGTGSLLEVNDAEYALATASLNRVSALYDYYVSKTELDRVTAAFDPVYFREVTH
jgi:outer membrane protein TolC